MKAIKVSQEVYEQLLSYRADCEKANKQRLSFSDAIDLLFTELAGLEYEVGSQKMAESRVQ